MRHIKILKFVFLFLICYYATIGYGQTTVKKYRILVLGLQDDSRQNASNLIADKWNIEFYGFGCVISQDLEDSVKKENDITNKLIASKYGKNWEGLFYDAIEEEYKIEAQIDELVKNQSFIRDKEIVNPLPGSPFPMHPIDKNGNYIVSVSTYNRKWEEQKLYKLKVNYKTNVVEIMNDYTNNR